jgi:hypothetical protein
VTFFARVPWIFFECEHDPPQRAAIADARAPQSIIFGREWSRESKKDLTGNLSYFTLRQSVIAMWYRSFAARARGSGFWSGLIVTLLLGFAVEPGFGGLQEQNLHIYGAGFSRPVLRSQARGPLLSVMSNAASYNLYSNALAGSFTRPMSDSANKAPQTDEQNPISPPKNPIALPTDPITPPTSLGLSSQTVQGVNSAPGVPQTASKKQSGQDSSATRARIQQEFQVAEDKAAHQ